MIHYIYSKEKAGPPRLHRSTAVISFKLESFQEGRWLPFKAAATFGSISNARHHYYSRLQDKQERGNAKSRGVRSERSARLHTDAPFVILLKSSPSQRHLCGKGGGAEGWGRRLLDEIICPLTSSQPATGVAPQTGPFVFLPPLRPP